LHRLAGRLARAAPSIGAYRPPARTVPDARNLKHAPFSRDVSPDRRRAPEFSMIRAITAMRTPLIRMAPRSRAAEHASRAARHPERP